MEIDGEKCPEEVEEELAEAAEFLEKRVRLFLTMPPMYMILYGAGVISLIKGGMLDTCMVIARGDKARAREILDEFSDATEVVFRRVIKETDEAREGKNNGTTKEEQ